MKIKISEVWNSEGKSIELAVINVLDPMYARRDVKLWIDANRPDLSLANDNYAHGFHAVEI